MEESEDDEGRRKQLEDARKNALYYGWEYFKYHAQQRQSVFRFYLILVGVALAGLFSSYSNQYQGLSEFRWIIGASLFLMSVMFWRLDVRSYELVKIAERYLKVEEIRLSLELPSETIRLTDRADSNKEDFWYHLSLKTFRQIYAIIFIVVGLGGLWLMAASLGWFSR